MRTIVMILLTIAVHTQKACGQGCEGLTPGEEQEKILVRSGTCYMVSARGVLLTWPQARNYCGSRGGLLAKIKNHETDEYLSTNLEDQVEFWIGLSRQQCQTKGFEWVYTDGELSQFTLLHDPPKYVGVLSTSVIYITVWSNFETAPWGASQPEVRRRFICQFDEQPTKLTSSMTVTVPEQAPAAGEQPTARTSPSTVTVLKEAPVAGEQPTMSTSSRTVTFPEQAPLTDVDTPAGTKLDVSPGQEETTEVERPTGTTPSVDEGQKESSANTKRGETSRQFILEAKMSGPVSSNPDFSIFTSVPLRCIQACLQRSGCVATSMNKQTGVCNLYLNRDILLSALHSDDSEQFLFHFLPAAF